MQRINGDASSASNTNVERDLTTNQVTDVPNSLPNDSVNKNIVINDPVEALNLKRGASLENTFHVIDSNLQEKYQHFVKASNVEKMD